MWNTLASELNQKPDVVVVWARPEIGRMWVFQELMKEGLITHLIGRPALPEEQDGVATTYPESRSIRKGLEFIRDNYGNDCYALVQSADISPKPGIFSHIDSEMMEKDGVLFFLNTGICHSDVWYTNFFAVSMNENYWPPLANMGDQDILERKWGLKLSKEKLNNFCKWHNNFDKSFIHAHESEGLPPELFKPQKSNVSVLMCITGWKPWYERLWDFFRRKKNG